MGGCPDGSHVEIRERGKSVEDDSRMENIKRKQKEEQTHHNLCSQFAFEIDI